MVNISCLPANPITMNTWTIKGGAAMKGIFESMFDLNHNGNISPLESAMEFTFLNELLKDNSEVQTELEFMDADERREALEDAGLDPDEYDF